MNVAVLGGGRMGEALAAGLIGAGWDADRVCDDLGPIVEDVLLPPLLS